MGKEGGKLDVNKKLGTMCDAIIRVTSLLWSPSCCVLHGQGCYLFLKRWTLHIRANQLRFAQTGPSYLDLKTSNN